MARYVVNLPAVALVANTVQTLWQLVTTSTKRIELIEAGISFDGITSSDKPATVDVLRQTSAGTATNTSQVPLKDDPADETPFTVYSRTFTAEPTASDILRSWYVTPNGGLWVYPAKLDLKGIWVPVSTRIAMRALAPTSGVNCLGYVVFNE